MSIIDLDGQFSYTPYSATQQQISLSHKSRRSFIQFGPHSLPEKWKVPKSGFYTPADVRLVVTPHISENAGVLAQVRLVDESDMSPSRVLYESNKFNLGLGITLEGSQLPFCLPIGEYPIHFEVMVLQSPYQATRTIFTTSLEWRMMWSPTPLSRVKSVFVTAHSDAVEATTRFRHLSLTEPSGNQSRVAQPSKKTKNRKHQGLVGGTTAGLVTSNCVGTMTDDVSNSEDF